MDAYYWRSVIIDGNGRGLCPGVDVDRLKMLHYKTMAIRSNQNVYYNRGRDRQQSLTGYK